MWPRSWWPRWQAPSHARMEVPAGQNRAPSAVVDWRRVDLVEDDAQEHASHANTCSDGVPAALGTDDVQERLPTPWSVVAGDAEKKKKNKFEDLEEHKGTTELLRAIKIEKANVPDLEEHKGAGELHMEPPNSKKRKRSRQSSGKHHGEHEETNKLIMKPSTSEKKRKVLPRSNKRLNKRCFN
ncbi:hypothetical protein ZWY2020_008748 [Hordeum vulgare]|nr:hypothetical protein ZWY2020_008748 [Hordeum vulgare]